MKHLRLFYTLIMKRWGYLLTGLLMMTLFAIFQGVSITTLAPLFDHVLATDKVEIIYTTLPEFAGEVSALATQYTVDNDWGAWLDLESLKGLWTQLQEVMSHTDSKMLLYTLCGLVVALILLKNLFYFLNRVCFTYVRASVLYEMRQRMFRQYMLQSLAFFHTNRVGDSLVRMVNDVNIISQYFVSTVFASLRDIMTVLIAGRIAIMLNGRLFLWSIVFLPIFTAIVSLLGNKIKKYARRMQNQASNMYSNVEEILNSMPVVKAFTRERYELDRFNRVNRKFTRFWRKGEIYTSLNTPISELNSTFVGAFLLILGGNLILGSSGEFTLGEFTAFLFAVFSMLHPLKNLTRAYTSVRKAMVSLDRVGWVLDQKPQIEDAPDAIDKPNFDRAIELRDVRFAYKDGEEVIRGVSFSINKGEKVGLVGSSGSGKTTLVNLINRMYDRTAGDIFIDGTPVDKIKQRDLHSMFGLVTQDSILFSATIADNIRYGSLREVDDQAIRNAAHIANADEFIEALPNSYDTLLQTKGGGLSGGQRQRLCIARAVVGDPPALIFDEATSALDTQAERKVQRGIEQATRNRTVIMIAHRLSTILACDKIVVMDKGRVVGVGAHSELLQSCPLYGELYRLQFEHDENTESA